MFSRRSGHFDEPEVQRKSQNYRNDTTPRQQRSRGRDEPDYSSRSLRRGRQLSDEFYDEGQSVRRGRKHPNSSYEAHGRRRSGDVSQRSSRYSDVYYSDDEDVRSRRRDRRKSRRSRGSSHYSESYSDSNGHSHRRGKSRRRRGPTSIDDFDEESWSETESESEFYTSTEESWSESDSEMRERHRLRSSASASKITNAAWALQGSDKETEARIKSQQAEIKALLSSLAELQKNLGVKALPPEKQKVLQQDLSNLGELQCLSREMDNNGGVLTQLMGQQMLLSEHLKDAIDFVKVQVRGCNECQHLSSLFLTL